MNICVVHHRDRFTSRHRATVAIAVLLLSAFGSDQCGYAGLVVTVNSDASVASNHITVGDVATVEGGTPADRKQIEALDLEVLSVGKSQCRLTRRQVEMRIRLEGFRMGSLTVLGPNLIHVRRLDEARFRGILEDRMESELARQFSLDPQDVSIAILEGHRLSDLERRLGQSWNATIVASPQLPLGKTSIDVEFISAGGDRTYESVQVRVVVDQNVVVATQFIPRGSVIADSAFTVIRRPIIRKADFAESQRVVGRIARVDIRPNDVVLQSHVTDITKNRTAIVQRNDLLDVVIKLRGSEIRLKNAQAMSSGNVGDTIAVLNTRSKKQLRATVVGQNLAIASSMNPTSNPANRSGSKTR